MKCFYSTPTFPLVVLLIVYKLTSTHILGILYRALGSDDVSLNITHCGVCYADVIWARNKLGDSKYPVVPGYVA